VQYSTVLSRYSAVQYSAQQVQCSTVQCSAGCFLNWFQLAGPVPYSTVLSRMLSKLVSACRYSAVQYSAQQDAF